MYQALYRKYRPTDFDEVVGQDVIKQTIINEINLNKISHAYLFVGPRGTGKTTIAKLVSKLVNCENIKDNKPCNSCVSCTQTNNGLNVDIIEIDGASNNGVDEIRELKSKVSLVPSYGKYKVYIIDEVHMMTSNAFNALLKTLEEPPRHVIFILATTDPQKIPSTILSRCQRFDFKKISVNNILKKLMYIVEKESIKIEEGVLAEIAKMSDGGLRDAIGILDQLNSYSLDKQIKIEDFNDLIGIVNKKEIIEFVENIKKSDVISSLKFIEKIDDSGKDVVNIMVQMLEIMRENMLEEYKNNNFNYITMIKSMNNYINEIKYSSNPRLLFELFVIENINLNETIYPEDKEKISNAIPFILEKNKKVKEAAEDEIIEKKENVNSDNKILISFEQIKEIRINNALSKLDKKTMNIISKLMQDLIEFSINQKYKKIIPILMDGEIKAYGNNQIIYVFKEDYCSNIFNENIELIEEIIFIKTKSKYKVISLTLEEWNKVKNDYNSKTKEYKYIEENFNIQMFAKKRKRKDSQDKIKDMFGEIVNYK